MDTVSADLRLISSSRKLVPINEKPLQQSPGRNICEENVVISRAACYQRNIQNAVTLLSDWTKSSDSAAFLNLSHVPGHAALF